MKKPKISLDSEKIQAFFLNHIEKYLFVLLLTVMLVLRLAVAASEQGHDARRARVQEHQHAAICG